jgi:hypothetical protein
LCLRISGEGARLTARWARSRSVEARTVVMPTSGVRRRWLDLGISCRPGGRCTPPIATTTPAIFLPRLLSAHCRSCEFRLSYFLSRGCDDASVSVARPDGARCGSAHREFHLRSGQSVGFLTHSVEIIVFLVALIAYWVHGGGSGFRFYFRS